MGCRSGYLILCLSSKSIGGLRYQLPASHLAREVTTPSTFDRRQSSVRNRWRIRATRPGDSGTGLQLWAPNKHAQQHPLVQAQRLRQPIAHLCYTEDDFDIDCLFAYATPGDVQEPHFYSQEFILQITSLKKLLLQYKAVVTAGNKIYLIPSSMILFKNIWIYVCGKTMANFAMPSQAFHHKQN